MKEVLKMGGAKFPEDNNKNNNKKERKMTLTKFEKWLESEAGKALLANLPVNDPKDFISWSLAGEMKEEDFIYLFNDKERADAIFECFENVEMLIYEKIYEILEERKNENE